MATLDNSKAHIVATYGARKCRHCKIKYGTYLDIYAFEKSKQKRGKRVTAEEYTHNLNKLMPNPCSKCSKSYIAAHSRIWVLYQKWPGVRKYHDDDDDKSSISTEFYYRNKYDDREFEENDYKDYIEEQRCISHYRICPCCGDGPSGYGGDCPSGYDSD